MADAITVLRDGSTVQMLDCREGPVSEDRVIQAMVGREMSDRYPQRQPQVGDIVFEVRNWRAHHPQRSDREHLKGIDLNVRRGEIVGIAGLMGAGRTELAMSIFGRSWGQRISGEVRLHGQPIDVSTVEKAVRHGLAYVTEDRKGNGLVLNEDIQFNTSLANLPGVSFASVIDSGQEHRVAQGYREKLRIRCSGVDQKTLNLSGGNQQKVVLSKWLFTSPEVLILDEPTRGIDVGAKAEIQEAVAELAEDGVAVVFISSELEEVVRLSERIVVLKDHRKIGEIQNGPDVTAQVIVDVIAAHGVEAAAETLDDTDGAVPDSIAPTTDKEAAR